MRQRPTWLVFLLLPCIHFASVKLTFLTAVTPENEVVVWLPNAVLLAAVLHYGGKRAWLLAPLTFASDVIANLPAFPARQAILLSLCNLLEVVIAYNLTKRFKAAPSLDRIADFAKFVVAGPVFGAIASAMPAAAILQTLDGVTTSYASLLLIWWYGDSLGLLIYTPLLLMLMRPRADILRHGPLEQLTLLVCAAFAVLIFSGQANRIDSDILLTPHLLLPAVLFVAVRYDTRWTAAAVAIVSLATAWAQTTGHRPFGNASPHMMILQTQEFILTLCVIGMGFAILLGEQRALARGLESMVHQRTSELEESNRRLALLSSTDGLTGIANRRHFDEALAHAWIHATRTGESLALAMLDVDLFKSYNDHYGHQAGDDCLRMVAKIMQGSVRRSLDLVARYGGEEFVYLGPGATRESAVEFAEAIRQAFHDSALAHALSPHGKVTVSIGVAVVVPAKGASAESLIKAADVALYQAKENGRDCVVAAA